MWRGEGFRGLFAGNGANCLRVFPFSGLVCLAYANLAKVSTLVGRIIHSSAHTYIQGEDDDILYTLIGLHEYSPL